MSAARLGVGIVGCGNISATYFRNVALFPGLELRGAADVVSKAAELRAGEYNVPAYGVDALLAAPGIDIVVNLTVPNAHFEVSMAALAAGKHVFTEKPLATSAEHGRMLVAEAARRGLGLASAPDTFLGAGGRLARRLIDAGDIGRPVAGTAFIMSHGMEHWHPNPEFFFKPGGGPVLDMGPYYVTALVNLLGPVARVVSMASIGEAERVVTAPGPHTGERITVETPTTVFAVLQFVGGAQVMLGMSWDVWAHGAAPIEIYGTLGSMRVPDPNTYGGVVQITRKDSEWESIPAEGDAFGAINWPFEGPMRMANYRMLGVAELAASVRSGTPARVSAGLALHVLEVLEATLRAPETGGVIALPPADIRPPPFSEAEALALLG